MAVPKPQTDTVPGQTRRQREADFAYLEAANDDAYASIDERYAASAYTDNLLKPVGIGKRASANDSGEPSPDQLEFDDAETSPDPQPRPSRGMREVLQNRVAKKLTNTMAKTGGRVRASAINTEAFSWQIPLWLFFQVPFAIIGIITLAVVGAMDTIESEAATGGVVEWVVNKALVAANALASFFGIDFLSIATNLYLITAVLILGIGIFNILFLYLQYTVGLLRPISGEGAGLKHGLLLLTIIGYSVPIANLFPFIFLWMAAVWYYPR